MMFVWLTVKLPMRVELKCVWVENGEQSAIILGTIETLKLYAGNWDTVETVSKPTA